jgi:hypothetical protein
MMVIALRWARRQCKGSGSAAAAVNVLWLSWRCGRSCFPAGGVALLQWQMRQCGGSGSAAIAVKALRLRQLRCGGKGRAV